MRALGHRIDPDLVFRARREVHSLAYRVPGLDGGTVERDYYSVFNSRTAALRFWHLFESVLEPSLPSVTTFSREWAGADRPPIYKFETGVTIDTGQTPQCSQLY
jgi:hypothetical protein